MFKGAAQVAEEVGKRPVECRVPGDNDVIEAVRSTVALQCGQGSLEPAADSVARDGVSQLLRNCEAEARTFVLNRSQFAFARF